MVTESECVKLKCNSTQHIHGKVLAKFSFGWQFQGVLSYTVDVDDASRSSFSVNGINHTEMSSKSITAPCKEEIVSGQIAIPWDFQSVSTNETKHNENYK